VKATYLYKLSNFVGAIPFSSPRIFADRVRNEIYILSGNAVSVFNASGMEIYEADYDPDTGTTYDLAVDGEGNVITLNYNGRMCSITLCNYRLEPQRTISLRNLPPEFASFSPNQLKYHNGHLYLGSTGAMKVVVTNMEGEYIKGYDLVAILGSDLDEKEKSRGRKRSEEQRRADNGLEGFNLDQEGNVLFVLPVLGRAGRISTTDRYNFSENAATAMANSGSPAALRRTGRATTWSPTSSGTSSSCSTRIWSMSWSSTPP
jgi:hypothetical protein